MNPVLEFSPEALHQSYNFICSDINDFVQTGPTEEGPVQDDLFYRFVNTYIRLLAFAPKADISLNRRVLKKKAFDTSVRKTFEINEDNSITMKNKVIQNGICTSAFFLKKILTGFNVPKEIGNPIILTIFLLYINEESEKLIENRILNPNLKLKEMITLKELEEQLIKESGPAAKNILILRINEIKAIFENLKAGIDYLPNIGI